MTAPAQYPSTQFQLPVLNNPNYMRQLHEPSPAILLAITYNLIAYDIEDDGSRTPRPITRTQAFITLLHLNDHKPLLNKLQYALSSSVQTHISQTLMIENTDHCISLLQDLKQALTWLNTLPNPLPPHSQHSTTAFTLTVQQTYVDTDR